MSAKIFLEKMSFNGNFICFDSLNLEFSILRMNIIKVFFCFNSAYIQLS